MFSVRKKKQYHEIFNNAYIGGALIKWDFGWELAL